MYDSQEQSFSYPSLRPFSFTLNTLDIRTLRELDGRHSKIPDDSELHQPASRYIVRGRCKVGASLFSNALPGHVQGRALQRLRPSKHSAAFGLLAKIAEARLRSGKMPIVRLRRVWAYHSAC